MANVYENQEDLNKIKEKAENILSKKYTEEEEKNFKKLVNQAVEVKKRIELAKKNSSEIITKTTVENMTKAQQQVYLTYKYIFDRFQPSFAEFFGLNERDRKGLVAIRDEKTNTAQLVELPLSEMFKIMIQNGGRIPKSIDIKQLGKKAVIKNNNSSNDSQKSANAAYQGTLNRLDRYWELRDKTYDINSKGYPRQKQQMILMWKINHDWHLATILNYGDVSEAYATAYLTEKNSLPTDIGAEKYYSHDLIEKFYWTYIRRVTNLKSLINEDIVLEKIEYAVKSNNASLPGLTQFEELAQFIIDLNRTISGKIEKDFEKEIDRLFGEKIDSGIRNVYIGTINDSFTDLSQELNSLSLKEGKNTTIQIKADLTNIFNNYKNNFFT